MEIHNNSNIIALACNTWEIPTRICIALAVIKRAISASCVALKRDTTFRISSAELFSDLRVLPYFEKLPLHATANAFIDLGLSTKRCVPICQTPVTCQRALLRKSSPSDKCVEAYTHYAQTSHPFLKSRVRSEFFAIPAYTTNNGRLPISRTFGAKRAHR